MVKIREAHTLGAELRADPRAILARIPTLGEARDSPRLLQALTRVRQTLAPAGNPEQRFAAALDILETLAGLGLDEEALVAGLFCVPLLDARIGLAAIRESEGAGCERLLAGVQRMEVLRLAGEEGAARGSLASRQRQGERLRRMLVALIDDPRVALVKLAERVQALRALSPRDEGEDAVALAREVTDI
ncbi:MAG: HD domain-containing protein, partial [Gammaproteobacteria bacterium]